MKYVGVLTVFAVLLASWLTNPSTVTAISASVVISQVQLGAVGASKQEFVQLHNNTAADINIADWCVVYSDYKDETRTTLRCFDLPAGVDELRMSPNGDVLIASQTYPFPTGLQAPERYVGSSLDMSGARGHIRLLDASGVEVDKVAWDNKSSTPPLSPESLASVAPAAGKSIARSGGITLVDTDNNFTDFREQVANPLNTGISEYVKPLPVIDLCQQDGIQSTLPEGYGFDEAGNCELLSSDICLNIEKIQTIVPEGLMVDQGNCYTDLCGNLDGLQREIPTGYVQNMGTCTVLENRALILTELLANGSGTDTGQEYIEIYNPFDEPVPLDGYTFWIGKNFEKHYAVVTEGANVLIEPHAYRYFRDDELGFSLLNTSSSVRLVAPAGNVVSETSYLNPKDDMSWSLLEGVWNYTNQATPGFENVASLIVDDEVVLGVSSALAPCPSGKYRHPVTNRCRNIEADASALATCDADEYRNPETNRCRKLASLASATLADCEDGYERNPDTNRCRKIATIASALKPCDAGFERNPDTNRCRAVASQATKTAGLTNAPSTQNTMNWPAVAGISTIAVGYAVYEWRTELMKGFGRLRARFIR
jgi:hypothetical protein